MALEYLTGTKYLDDLVATNPAAGDNVSEGDDHIRGIKNVLKLTFPNVDAAVNATPTELNYVDGVTSAIQTQLNAITAGDWVTSARIADDAIDSEHYTDGSIDNAHIADDAIDSEHYAAGSIDTAHIADDQITLAKMAGGTDGNIISYDASGNPVAIATGNDGQVLTSAGAGQPPAFETLSAGTDGTPNFFVYLSGNQTISDQTLTKVTWDTEDFDSDSAFASNKFTVPSGEGGVYNFSVYYHTSGANRYMFCKVYKNGALFAQNTGFDDNDDATGQTTSLSILMSLSATDYIETYIYTDTSGGGTVALKAANRASFFSGYRVA